MEEYNIDDNSLKWTTNSNYHKKKLKKQRGMDGDIRCSYCPYNRHENGKRFPRKSWKHWRKTQYKPV